MYPSRSRTQALRVQSKNRYPSSTPLRQHNDHQGDLTMRHCLFGLLMAASVTANAAIQTQEIPYTAADGTEMIG